MAPVLGLDQGLVAGSYKKEARMSRIAIVDLEVFYCIGVTDEERAKPQRLLLTVEMNFDFSSAVMSDRIEKTINYHTVVQELLKFGTARNWKLLERLVSNIADRLLTEYNLQAVVVEAKKFAIPEARYVAVSVTKTRRG